MSDIQIIESVLEQATTRRRWQRAWRALWLGLLIGGLVWFAALGTYKLFPVPPALLPMAGLLMAIFMMAGFLAGWWQKATLPETARWRQPAAVAGAPQHGPGTRGLWPKLGVAEVGYR